jgi:hypothetical protein
LFVGAHRVGAPVTSGVTTRGLGVSPMHHLRGSSGGRASKSNWPSKETTVAGDFDLITEEDKRHMSYGLCVLGHVAAGATLGSMAGGQTLLGAAGGTVWGLFNCKHLAEPIKRKLFSQRERLSDWEFRQVLAAAKRQFPLASKPQLLGLIAQARVDSYRSPHRFNG